MNEIDWDNPEEVKKLASKYPKILIKERNETLKRYRDKNKDYFKEYNKKHKSKLLEQARIRDRKKRAEQRVKREEKAIIKKMTIKEYLKEDKSNY